MSSGEQRDKRKFIEDFVLAVAVRKGSFADINATRRVIGTALVAWEEIETQTPYER